jgi:ubiquinone/menaquinone biosynthesis C-methylase UbiE
MARILRMVGATHGKLVHDRRVQMLACAIAPLIEPRWTVLDVGCGDGRLAALIRDQVAGIRIEGYDLLVRQDAAIPVRPFDGRRIPQADRSVDAVMMVDVLHHTEDPTVLLREAARVATKAIILKDHRLSRPLAGPTLRFMDWLGKREAWAALGLEVDHYQTRIGLYPLAARWLFEPGLHFVARLTPDRETPRPENA